jgi:hypothetical protein
MGTAMIQISPPNPSSSDDVVISASAIVDCISNSGMVQSGFTFTGFINYGICFATPPAPSPFPFRVGKLAPGNYTVTVQDFFGIQPGAFSVVVAAAPIPTIDQLGLVLMAALIVLFTIPGLLRR